VSEYQDIYRKRLYENQGFPELIDSILPEHHRILDIGCGNGANLFLLSQHGHEAVGLTLSDTEVRLVQERGMECKVWDIMQEELPYQHHSFDAILLSHVLEHLPWPEKVLRHYLNLVRPGGGVYIALPNVLNLIQRWQFLCGQFKYTENGVMDCTHLRFFDFLSARELAESCGLKVVRHFGIGQCPMGPLRKLTPHLGKIIDRRVSCYWPGLFAFHSIVIAVTVK
jgi:2-polyprenyl-3-methyl-5-hydroxy-6-metoxy-1,4-benzoquinol methylase